MISRIGRLVRTELESYVHDLVVWGGTVFFLLFFFLSFVGTVVVVARSGDSSAGDLSGVLLLSVILSSALLAVKVSRRNALEKRTRLFSQLPVSPREVSLASWCVRLLWLSIPTLAFSVFIAREANMPFATFALVTLATYMGGTALVAARSVEMSIRHLPSRMAAWAKGVYMACAIAAVGIWFLGNLLVFPFDAIRSRAGASLPGLTGFLIVTAVGLVVVDIWLRDRADEYLG